MFSIEIRKERGEQFLALAGFFERFELILVAADERDLMRVRTSVRGKDVFLYRVEMPPEARRALLLAYLVEAGAVCRVPQRCHETADFELKLFVVWGFATPYEPVQ